MAVLYHIRPNSGGYSITETQGPLTLTWPQHFLTREWARQHVAANAPGLVLWTERGATLTGELRLTHTCDGCGGPATPADRAPDVDYYCQDCRAQDLRTFGNPAREAAL